MVPSSALAQMSRMATIFEPEKPQPRNASSLVASTACGSGKSPGGNKRAEPGQYRLGRAAVELLVRDRPHQGFVRAALALDLHPRRPDPPDECGKSFVATKMLLRHA